MDVKQGSRGRIAAWLLALAASAAAPAVLAQPAPAARAASPAIDGLEVNADAGLQPGSSIEFRMRGAPRGIARVQVQDSGVSLPLAEAAPGEYVGTYTVRRTDRLRAQQLIRGELTVAGRTSVSQFRFPPSFAQADVATAPAGALPAPALRLDRFAAPQVDQLSPGTELRFTIDGTPGAYATVQLPGFSTPLVLREERPGHYAGQYVLRQQDVLLQGPVVATLRAGEKTVTAQLARPLLAGAPDPVRSPPATMGAAPVGVLPLQVTSPGPNAAVDAGQVVVQGRTAPGANVRVRIDAVPPAAPGRAAVAQSLPERSVVADANGHFSFNLGPVRAQPGTRFELNLSAAQGGQAAPAQRLVLFQGG